MTKREILNQLQDENLRLAQTDESGWTYTYIDEDGNRITLWVTVAQ